jgi:hypothetical protein
MKLLLAPVALSLALLTSGGAAAAEASPAAGQCFVDNEIPPSDRSTALALATTFHDLVSRSADTDAYCMLSAAIRSRYSFEAFRAITVPLRAQGPLTDLKLEHAYLVRGAKTAQFSTRCASSAPDAVVLSTFEMPMQIHLVMSARTFNGETFAFTIWLYPEGTTWRIHAFFYTPITMLGRGAMDLLADAREQRRQGHNFNAAMLFVAAQTLLYRGPDVELVASQQLREELATFQLPPEFAGVPPYTWRLGQSVFTVENATILGAEGRVVLVLTHSDPAWNGTDYDFADTRNKAFIDAFLKSHPEISATFSMVAAHLLKPNKVERWGTVYEFGKGYRPMAPTPAPEQPVQGRTLW